MTESNAELIDMFLYPTLKSMLRDILNKFDYMLRHKDIYLPEAIKDVEHDVELLSRLKRGEEAEKANKELKEKVAQLENQFIQDNALLEVIDDYVTKGIMPDDFMMSFGFVDDVVTQFAELRKQVEKMKCCENCTYGNQEWGNPCYDCDKYSEWEERK